MPHAEKSGDGRPLPKGLADFRRFLLVVGRIELWLAIVALLVVVALSTAQAGLRYSVGASLWWAQEIAENTIMVAYFLGVSYVFKTRQYIVIEFVSSIAPMRVQMILYIIAQILALLFAIGTLYLVYLFSPTLLNMTTPVLKLPAIITPAPLIVASAMIALTSVYYLSFAFWALISGVTGTSLDDIEAVALIDLPLVQDE